jgi:DNA-binding beta-propeller fold protein YncE
MGMRKFPAKPGVNTVFTRDAGRREGMVRQITATITAALMLGVPTAAALSTSPSEYRTPQGWLLRPAGMQVDTTRTTDGVAVSPDGQTVYATGAGQFLHSLTSFDAGQGVPETNPVGEAYMGVTSDGLGHVWASGGSANRVWQFLAAGPATIGTRQLPAVPGAPNNGIKVLGYPGNMVLDGAAHKLYVAGNLAVPQSAINAFDPAAGRCPGGSPVCSVINVIDVSDPSDTSQPKVHVIPVGRDAFGLVLDRAHGRLYVTNWADEFGRGAGTGRVSVVDIAAAREVDTLTVGRHPTGIALSTDGSRLAIADTADDRLHVFPIAADGAVGTPVVSDVHTALTDYATRGVHPLGLAYDPDGTALYVAEGGINAVEVRHPDGTAMPRTVRANGRVLALPGSYIPAGWYPAALATSSYSPDTSANRLYVANLKGMGAGPGFFELVTGARSQGSVSSIDIPVDPARRETALDGWSATVAENDRWTEDLGPDAACGSVSVPGSGPVSSRVLCAAARNAARAKQLHVVYVVKENKTFDQYFGDLKATVPDADASPEWLLYGSNVTTNQHRLAARYAIDDNFWADSEQSTTGHSWTSAGYASDFNELTWSTSAGYDEGLRGDRWGGQYDGQLSGPRDPEVARDESLLARPDKRLVDLLADPATNPGGATFRIYSDDVGAGTPAAEEQIPQAYWGLKPSSFNHGRDLDFPDTDRADIFLHGSTVSHSWSADRGAPPPDYGKRIAMSDAQKAHFTLDGWTSAYAQCMRSPGASDAACQASMPNFLYVALPVDHTLGFNPNNPTPASMVADNDYAVGQIVDALSRSPFWKNTLVVVTEDDTQASGDHVDGHRTFALTAGGLARPLGASGRAAHQVGSFPSILKTVETIFSLPPLTVFDRAAPPLYQLIVNRAKDADLQPYDAVKPPTPFARNPDATQLAALSTKMNWKLDRTNPALLHDLLYAGLRNRPLSARAVERLSPEQRRLPLRGRPLPGRR